MDLTQFFSMEMFLQPEYYVGALFMFAFSYLIGSINAGHILSLIGSKNLGEEGSKSFGATNAGRVYGAKGFAIVFFIDMVKALFVTALLLGFCNANPTLFNQGWINLSLIFVVVGHCWPIFFKFKGGKGVATSFGCVLVINWVFAILAISVFFVVKIVNGWTSNASIVGVSVGVILVMSLHWLFVNSPAGIVLFEWSNTWLAIPSSFTVGLISVLRHWPNVKEMIDGDKPWKRVKE